MGLLYFIVSSRTNKLWAHYQTLTQKIIIQPHSVTKQLYQVEQNCTVSSPDYEERLVHNVPVLGFFFSKLLNTRKARCTSSSNLYTNVQARESWPPTTQCLIQYLGDIRERTLYIMSLFLVSSYLNFWTQERLGAPRRRTSIQTSKHEKVDHQPHSVFWYNISATYEKGLCT